MPKNFIIDRYYLPEKETIEQLKAKKEAITTQLTELEEEHSNEDGCFADFDKVNKAAVQKRVKEIIDTSKLKDPNDEEVQVLIAYLKLAEKQAELNNKIRELSTELDYKALNYYQSLTEADIKQLVVDDKWMTSIERSVKTEMERISQRLTQRIKELAERYETPLPEQTAQVEALEAKVKAHLASMGFSL